MGWFCPRCGHQADAAGACPRDAEALARVSSHDLLGRTIGEYTVLASLGGGSYGRVYRAVHARSGMLVAIKLLYHPIGSDESKRVLVEARAAAQLAHGNIVKVYDLALTVDRRPYIVMELLDGEALAALITRPVTIEIALSIAKDVLAGLAVAHAKGVIHRDLKPENVLITKSRAVIVDFGLAKLVTDPKSRVTVTGEALGTPHYMAPEQVRGDEADGRADLYALGCLLFEILAGRPPFVGSGTFAVFDAHLSAPVPRVRDHRADVPAHVDDAIARALAKDPVARFQTAAEMQRALAGIRPRRKRWPYAVAGAVALAGIATAAAIAGGDPSTPSPTPAPPTRTAELPPRTIAIPPALPDEPPLDQGLTATLEGLQGAFARGGLTRDKVVDMRCAVQPTYADPPAGIPAMQRGFIRRYVALIEAYVPDVDVARDCEAAKAARIAARKIATPEPLADELPKYDMFEQLLATYHDELAAGRLTAVTARSMRCSLIDQADDAITRTGTETRQALGFRRRFDLLLDTYLPGVSNRPCH
jgi:serine/threonine protein kinase